MTKKRESKDLFPTELKRAAHILRALNHPLRQKILRLLHKRGRLSVTEVAQTLKVVQPDASLHLAILRCAKQLLSAYPYYPFLHLLQSHKLEMRFGVIRFASSKQNGYFNNKETRRFLDRFSPSGGR